MIWIRIKCCPRYTAPAVHDMTPPFVESLRHLEDEAGKFWIEAVDDVLIVAVTDPSGKILYANERFCEISGFSQQELIGANHRILNSGTHDRTFFRDMFRTIHSGQTWRGEICNRAKNGTLYWVATTIIPEMKEDGRVRRFVSCRFDITEQKAAEIRLREMAITDALTGLQNRRGFQVRFADLLAQAQEQDDELAILMLDIDHFKDVNDANGHDLGDLFLKAVAARLQAMMAPSDLIARLGGDEIAIVRLPLLEPLLEGIQDAVRTPVDLGAGSVSATVSIGMAMYPRDGTNTIDLVKSADVALYNAKRMGRNRVSSFKPDMLARTRRRITTQENAFLGLARQEFELFYQPIISLKGNEAPSCEALLRWHHPTQGLLAPGSFMDIFENHRLAAAVGEYVRDAVLVQAAEWQRMAVPVQTVKFNTSAADFELPDFADRLLLRLHAKGLTVDQIGVEVTEGMFLGQQSDVIRRELAILCEAGVEVAFDDFGTGFASLTHLKELPITRLKIDRSFITNIMADERDRKIVRALLDLCQSLGFLVTAEGVETEEQLQLLNEMGCDRIQGFLISKPRPAADMPGILSNLPSFTLPRNLRLQRVA
jgi:diguanylate cyclase (GGDEF)-like protein/PAS domain S-box-containing protein